MLKGRFTLLTMALVGLVFAGLTGYYLQQSKKIPHEQFQEKKLRVLTYSSFAGVAGPGGQLIAEFKNRCQCKVELLTAGDAGLIVERTKLLEAASQPVDVVLGIDQMALESAKPLQFKKLKVDTSDFFAIPAGHLEEQFVPFDWSLMSFVYRKSEIKPPSQFSDLSKPEFRGKIALQDPRSSSPGLQFLQWVRGTQGPKAQEFLRSFKNNVASVSPSWSFSYGLFKKGQADLVFSYVTSLAYHWGMEKDRNYQIAEFKEGHPVQVEYVAIPKSCRECDLAEQFIKFILEEPQQKILMEKNFMFPVLKSVVRGTVFAEMPQFKELALPKDQDLGPWNAVFQ